MCPDERCSFFEQRVSLTEAVGKLPTFRVYDLRHAYATQLLARGDVPVIYVSAQLGHAKPTTTLQWYKSVDGGLIVDRQLREGCAVRSYRSGGRRGRPPGRSCPTVADCRSGPRA